MHCCNGSYSTNSSDSSNSSCSFSTASTTTLVSIDTSHNASTSVQPLPGPSDWNRVRSLGEGASSKVLLVRHQETHVPAALKIIPKSGVTSTRAVLREQRIHSRLTESMGDLIVPLKASFHDSKNFYLVMDFLPGGDLTHEMLRCGSFDRQRAQLYCAELVLILERLHAHRIIHRDLKPANVLIRSDGHLALGDFGLSYDFNYRSRGPLGLGLDKDLFDCDAESNSFMSTFSIYTTSEYAGTPYYMSPEQHRGMNYSFDADWWALGVMLYLMLTGRLPFAMTAETPAEIAFSIALEPLVFEKADKVDSVARDLIRSLLTKNRQDRLCDPKRIKAHPFFFGLDWDKVVHRSYVPKWVPFVPPISKPRSRGLGDISVGIQFATRHEPYQSFNWVSPALAAAPPSSPIRTYRKAFRSVGRLVRIVSRRDIKISSH